MDALLTSVREKLDHVTPLRRDCGRVCGAACCRSLEGEETGMLLFPGEAEAYSGKEEWEIRAAALGEMVICPGRCDRAERPLSCRLFPLLPLPREDGEDSSVRVAVDLRAKAVCPLARQGKRAMDPAFIDAVRAAGELLMQDEEQAAFLRELAAEQLELKELRDRWMGGGAHA